MREEPELSAELGENHRRGISTTLALVDETLGHVEDWASGRERKGVLYQERNNLAPGRKTALLREVARIRGQIDATRRDLQLQVTSCDAASDVWSRISALREVVMEVDGRQLRRYGDVAPAVERYMDTLSRELLAGLDRLLSALGGAKAGP